MEEWIERYRLAIALVLVAITISGVAAFLVRRPDSRPIEIVTPTRMPRATAQPLKVYVTGEVARPGVYTLAESDRVEDAIKVAGGPTSDADLIKINLAAKVYDQLQIHVPKRNDNSSSVPVDVFIPSAPSKVNINAATAPELESLPGIGPATARRILAYRQQNGAFKRIEELKEAKLVNAATYDKIKDLVSVY